MRRIRCGPHCSYKQIGPGTQLIAYPPPHWKQRPGDTIEERRQFTFFQRLTVPGVAGFFNSRLWTALVLPMCNSEQAVVHNVVVLSTLHEDLEARMAPLSREDLSNRHHRFALCQYGRSLALLNERRHSQDPKLRGVILTYCLLFVAFDLLRGQRSPVWRHSLSSLGSLHSTFPASCSHNENSSYNSFRCQTGPGPDIGTRYSRMLLSKVSQLLKDTMHAMPADTRW